MQKKILKVFTNLLEHLVTFVENKDLDTAKAKMLVANQGVETTGGRNDDVRVLLFVLQDLNVLLHRRAAVEDRGLDVRHVLAEPGVLVLDLIRQLAGVAHHQNGSLAGDRLDLLKSGEDKDGSLSKTRLGLAKDIGTENRLRNADLLN